MNFLEDDVLEQIDWDNLLDGLPDSDNIFAVESPPLVTDTPPIENVNPANSSTDTVSCWIGEIENLLMNDDGDQQGSCNEFLADILVDSPADDSAGEVFDTTTNDIKDSSPSRDGDGSASAAEEEEEEEKDDGAEEEEKYVGTEEENNKEEDDPISKKRRRQLRNRDAAMRSRERKKMYVKDLEMKSRYLEGECRRLDRLLQCIIAENHALRLSLQRGSACGVTLAKQESAVLLLESLLLGSLLWFLGIMCLFTLPLLPQSTPVAVLSETMERKTPENVVPRGAGSKTSTSLANSRRFKASRPRMKLTDHVNLSYSQFSLAVKV